MEGSDPVLEIHGIIKEDQRVCDSCNVAIWISHGDAIVFGSTADHVFMAGTVFCSDNCRENLKESFNA